MTRHKGWSRRRSLRNLTVPRLTLGDNALVTNRRQPFNGCQNLNRRADPSATKVTYIGSGAFSACAKTSAYVHARAHHRLQRGNHQKSTSVPDVAASSSGRAQPARAPLDEIGQEHSLAAQALTAGTDFGENLYAYIGNTASGCSKAHRRARHLSDCDYCIRAKVLS